MGQRTMPDVTQVIAPAGATGVLLRVSWALAAATVLSQICWVLVSGGARDALTIAGVCCFFGASLAHSAATRPAAWTLRFFATTLVFGWVIEAVGTATGWPFGPYSYADRLGPALGPVPVLIPLAWSMMAYPVYLAAGRATRSAVARVALAGVLLASWDLFLDPQMVGEGHWSFVDPTPALPGVPGIPLTNYAGWLLSAWVLMALCDRLAGPVPAGAVVSPPTLLLAWVYLSNVLANAVFFGRPAVALIGGVVMGAALLPVARALRRDATDPTRRAP